MSIKLTDTQFLMLSAAAQREDRRLVAPKSLKGGAATWTISPLATFASMQAFTVRRKIRRNRPALQRWRMRVSDERSGSASCRP